MLLLGMAVVALAMLVGFYTGFRAPNLWSTHYWQASWADGFYRRGLLGMFLLPFDCARLDYFFVQRVQLAVMVGLFATSVWPQVARIKYFGEKTSRAAWVYAAGMAATFSSIQLTYMDGDSPRPWDWYHLSTFLYYVDAQFVYIPRL